MVRGTHVYRRRLLASTPERSGGPGGYIDARYRAMTAVRRGLACMCPRAMAASAARANPHSLQAGCGLRGRRRQAAARERTPRRNIRRGGLAAQRVDQRTSAFGGCLAHRERGGGSKAAEGRRPTTLLGKPCVGGVGVGRRCGVVEMRREERRGEERRGAIGGPAPPWSWRVRPAPWCGVGAIRTNRTNEPAN